MNNVINETNRLEIINSMISTARGNVHKGAGKQFILWGYVILLASLANYLTIHIKFLQNGNVMSFIWLGFTSIGFVLSFIIGFTDSKKQ